MFMEISPAGRKINFPMLSDQTHEVSKTYGILDEAGGYAYRATFIIDPEGGIQAFSVNPQPVGRNIDEILRILAGLQYTEKTGMGAPSGWVPGDPGIPTGWEYVGKY
jgi:peroxiredoxin (alkyl hydroperoxide reductase subunit C)